MRYDKGGIFDVIMRNRLLKRQMDKRTYLASKIPPLETRVV